MSGDIIFGVLGKTEASKKLIAAGLSELRDKAAVDDVAFWGVIGLTPESGESYGWLMDWLIEEGIAYDIVVHPDVAEQLPEEYGQNAEKTMKSKAVPKKVVDHVLQNEGNTIIAFIGDDTEQTEDIIAAISYATDNGLTTYDICDAMREVSFGEEGGDATGDEDEEIDFEALGEAADGGDEEAQAKLTELAEGNIEQDTFDSSSWSEVASLLAEMANESESAEDVPAKSKATKAAPSSKKAPAPNKWTEEELDGKEIKELREIAKAAGVEGAGKMNFSTLKSKLVGVAKGDAAEEPETAPEEAPAKKAPASKTKAPAAKKEQADKEDEPMGANELAANLSKFFAALAKAIEAL